MPEQPVIYVDVLFVINFVMDYGVLWAAARISRSRFRSLAFGVCGLPRGDLRHPGAAAGPLLPVRHLVQVSGFPGHARGRVCALGMEAVWASAAVLLPDCLSDGRGGAGIRLFPEQFHHPAGFQQRAAPVPVAGRCPGHRGSARQVGSGVPEKDVFTGHAEGSGADQSCRATRSGWMGWWIPATSWWTRSPALR